MPLYEGISSLGLFVEKHTAVVFDFGTEYTKVGFAGESGPRAIIPSLIECPDTGQMVPVFEDRTPRTLRHRLAAFVHKMYIRNLLINPKERRVVVVENLLCATLVKDTIASVLFRHCEVVSIAFVPSHLVSLLTLGVNTGLVIDVGHSEASVIPIYEGVPILVAWQALALGTKFVQKSLKSLLEDRGSLIGVSGKEEKVDPEVLTHDTIEDITVRCCFVSTPERTERLLLNKADRSNEPPPPPPDVMYPLNGAQALKVPGTVRELAAEVFFESDADNLSLSTMVMDAIVQCPVDTRFPLAANLVVIGGGAMMLGLRKRLLQELSTLATKQRYRDHMAPPVFKMHTPPVKENYAAWLGGAIMGSTEAGVVPRSVTREMYLTACNANAPLPDWCSLMHNTLEDARAPA